MRKSQQQQMPIIIIWFNFQDKTRLDISCESSAKQTICMKYQDLFFFWKQIKKKKKKKKKEKQKKKKKKKRQLKTNKKR